MGNYNNYNDFNDYLITEAMRGYGGILRLPNLREILRSLKKDKL